jgi:hypothetical protein
MKGKAPWAGGRWQVALPPRLGAVLVVLAVPFVVLGLLVLGLNLHGLVRYDPAYFTPEYLEEYGQPSQVVWVLEQALQTGNRPLLAGLQGLRRPSRFETGDAISFVRLWERTGRYVTYLYVDMHSYERYPYHLEQIKGRWVVAPEDVRYYLYSGRWKDLFLPLAIAWWILGLGVLGFAWLLRDSESLRSRLFDK